MKWVLLCWWHFIKLIFLIILSAPNKIMGSWTHSCRSYSPLIIEDWMNIKYVMVIYSETPDTTYWLWDIETSMLSYDPVAKNYGWQELFMNGGTLNCVINIWTMDIKLQFWVKVCVKCLTQNHKSLYYTV